MIQCPFHKLGNAHPFREIDTFTNGALTCPPTG